jgi:predicted negative regulator of RcsB-dependent stress response
MNELAYLLADSAGKAEEALGLIDAALKQSNDPALVDTKGWALYRLRRYAEAEPLLRSAADTLENSTVIEHLGDVLLAQGRTAEAVALYERALAAPDATARRRRALEQKIDRARDPVSAPAA